MQRSPELFPDPLVFRPERFATTDKDGSSIYKFLAFSVGPRNCIGVYYTINYCWYKKIMYFVNIILFS